MGASSGFGREFVKLLADEKNEIIAVSNDRKGLDSLKEDVFLNRGCIIETVCRDFTVAGDLDYVCTHYTDCDLLINSAGGGKLGGVTSLSIEEEQYYIDLNVRAFHKITKTALLKMIAKKRGAMLNVCSTASFTPLPNFSIYAATKAFAGSYTLSLSREAIKYGVKVMALCPGPTRTGFLSQAHYGLIQKKFGPLPILMSPDKVARGALKKFSKGKILYIPGFINKLNYILDRISPRKLTNSIIYKMLDGLENFGDD